MGMFNLTKNQLIHITNKRNVQTNKLMNISEEQFTDDMREMVEKLKPDRFVQFQLNERSENRINMIRVIEEDKTKRTENGHDDFIKLVTELRMIHSYNLRACFVDEKQDFHEKLATYGILTTKETVEIIAITAKLVKNGNEINIRYYLHRIGLFEGTTSLNSNYNSRLDLRAWILTMLKNCTNEHEEIAKYLQTRKGKKSGILLSARKSNEVIEILPGDTLCFADGQMIHQVKGVVSSVIISEKEKHVVLVKGPSDHHWLYLKIHHIPIKIERPYFSLYLNDSATCIFYHDDKQYGKFDNIEVSLPGNCLSTISLSRDDKKRVMMDILCELECIHSQKIIHNDIKLENIVFYETEEHVQYAKLIDFECSKQFITYT